MWSHMANLPEILVQAGALAWLAHDSFVNNKVEPVWAIALLVMGEFASSLVAVALTGIKQVNLSLKQLGRRMIRCGIGRRWYLTAAGWIAWLEYTPYVFFVVVIARLWSRESRSK